MENDEKEYLYQLGRKIERLYREKFSSQNVFAKAVDCDNRTIRRIIRGEQNISIILAIKISKALNIKLTDLLNIE
jgi:DNA-binding XRE family transcriptional regulator